MSIVTVTLDTQHILSGGTADKGQLVQNRARLKGDDLDWIQRIFWKAKIVLAVCNTLKERPLGVMVSLHGQLEWALNHLGDTSLSILRACPEILK